LGRRTRFLYPVAAPMTRSVTLDARQRQALLDRYRKAPDPDVRFRAHILLLLADGHTWETITALLFCSSRTIDRWVKRFHEEGVEGVAGHKPGRRFRFDPACMAVVLYWVINKLPGDFGFLRSRWTCGTLALLLWSRHGLDVSAETVRRWLHRGEMVYRRPRPTVGSRDEEREARLAAIRELLAGLPPDETVVWEDEADINTNPEIGRMWMRRGQQAKIPTPGTNQKRYVAGSIHWRTGTVFATRGRKRDEGLFLAHLEDLRHRLRRYRKIHVICDCAGFHHSDAVRAYLAEYRDRIELEMLPTYSPDANPMERIWWLVREHITRNHRCHDPEELTAMVLAYLESEGPFRLEDEEYKIPRAA
jgi:putative transposase